VLVIQTMMVVLFFYTTTYKVPPYWFAFAQPCLKLFDVITDPLIGQISDNTKSRWGRRRPFILGGGMAMAGVYFLLWSPEFVLFWVEQPSVQLIFTSYVLFYLLYYLTHTVSAVPYHALGAELTKDYDERTRVFQVRHLIAIPAVPLGTLAYYLATNPRLFESERTGMSVCAGIVALVVVAMTMVTSVGTKESTHLRRQPRMGMSEAMRLTFANRSFLFLALCIFLFSMGWIFTVEFASFRLTFEVFGGDKHAFAALNITYSMVVLAVALASNLLVRGTATRVGKRAAFIAFASATLLIPLASLFAFDSEHPYLYLLVGVGIGIASPGMEILSLAMIADVSDFDELKSNRRREGAFTGVLNAAQKAGIVLAPALAMMCLHLCG
ncbi:MAG: MFS transporter, partial [bacterium]